MTKRANHPIDLLSLDARAHEIIRALQRVVVAREALIGAARKSLGNSTGEILALGHLWTVSSISMQDLAEIIGVSGPTMTAIADKLVALEWITREPDPLDRRRTLLAATSNSFVAFKPWIDPVIAVHTATISKLSAQQAETVLAFLNQMHQGYLENTPS